MRRILFEHTSVRPRRSASALPPAPRAYCPEPVHGTFLSPVFSSITGMSDGAEVPASVAGLEKWIYSRFRREADKHLEVYAGPKAKLRLSHELIQGMR